MPTDDARRFVVRMREDRIFRKRVLQAVSHEDLDTVLQGEGMLFEKRELAGAMAECITHMEQR